MNEHPDDLLAEYVDGDLAAPDRAEVDTHLAACARCRDEVALAREVVGKLAAAPPIEPPLGLTRDVVRSARRPSVWQRPSTWAAASAAAAVVAVGAFLTLRPQGDQSQPNATAPAAEQADRGEASSADEESATAAPLAADLRYPVLRPSEEDYTPARLAERARELATEAEEATAQGFPATATGFYSVVDLRGVDPPLAEALECASSGVPPDRAAVPFVVEAALFEGIPAYLASFLRGDGADAPYDQVQLLVVDRETCSVRHFSRQRL